jgi:DNA-binding CsgD family transcriptional regulator/PAS domain-containing protein
MGAYPGAAGMSGTGVCNVSGPCYGARPPPEMNNTQLRKLLTLGYRAAVDPDRWGGFLQQMASTLNSPTCGLLYYDTRQSAGSIAQFVGIAPDVLRAYDEYYGARNEYMLRAADRFQSGVTLPSHALVPDAELKRTEWFNDYLAPNGIERNVGVCLFREGGVMTNMTLMRRGRVHSEAELKFVRALVPHVQQALRVHRQLAGLQRPNLEALELLDRVPAGLVLLDRGDRVVVMNEAARAIVSSGDGLTVQQGYLRGATSSCTAALRAQVSIALECATAGDRDVRQAPALLRLERPSLRPPLSVFVVPVAEPPIALRARALAVIATPERRLAIDPDSVRQLFGLTRAETAVLEHLAAGSTTSEAADALGISTHTARTHAKRLLRKTGAAHNADLVRHFSPVAARTLVTPSKQT